MKYEVLFKWTTSEVAFGVATIEATSLEEAREIAEDEGGCLVERWSKPEVVDGDTTVEAVQLCTEDPK
jgi:hypothetical protein